MTASVADHDEYVVVKSAMGTFELYRDVKWFGAKWPDQWFAGPGGITKAVTPRGKVLTDDLATHTPDSGVNVTGHGGWGHFGIQTRRQGAKPENLTTRRPQVIGGHGVIGSKLLASDGNGAAVVRAHADLCDVASHPKPIIRVEWKWRFTDERVACVTTVSVVWDGKGPQLWVKEPKVAYAVQGYKYVEGITFGEFTRKWRLGQKKDPTKSTFQFRADKRKAIIFTAAGMPKLRIDGRGYEGGETYEWSTNHGFDRWRRDTNTGPFYEPWTPRQRYCLQGPPMGLPAHTWEIGSWPPHAMANFAAWGGGASFEDCWCAGVKAVPGKSYSSWHSVTLS